MSWLLVPWLQGHLIMHEPALILFQTGFHISTQITILHPMSKSKVRGSYMKTKIRKDQLTKEEMEELEDGNKRFSFVDREVMIASESLGFAGATICGSYKKDDFGNLLKDNEVYNLDKKHQTSNFTIGGGIGVDV